MEFSKRIVYIDLAKGFCIILVVLTHVNTYYEIDYALKDVLASFRMPLYFILSGLFFKTYGGFTEFLKRKVNNLLIPFFFFYLILSFGIPNILYICGYSVRNADLLGWKSIFNFIFYDYFSNSPIWFLLCLFWVNLISYKVIKIKSKLLKCIAVIILGSLGYILGRNNVQVYMWIDAALTAIPFFCFGYILKKRTNLLYPNKYDKYLPLYSLICFCFVCFFSVSINFVGNRFPPMSFDNLYACGIIGTLFVLFISKYLKSIPLISYWGRYSIIILCVHNPIIQIVVPFVNLLHINALLSMLITLLIVMMLFLVIIPLMKRFFPYVTAQKNLIPIS